jgi:hypothetical protein
MVDAYYLGHLQSESAKVELYLVKQGGENGATESLGVALLPLAKLLRGDSNF